MSRFNFDPNQPRSDLIKKAMSLFEKAEETAFTNAEVLIQVHAKLYYPSSPPSPLTSTVLSEATYVGRLANALPFPDNLYSHLLWY